MRFGTGFSSKLSKLTAEIRYLAEQESGDGGDGGDGDDDANGDGRAHRPAFSAPDLEWSPGRLPRTVLSCSQGPAYSPAGTDGYCVPQATRRRVDSSDAWHLKHSSSRQ